MNHADAEDVQRAKEHLALCARLNEVAEHLQRLLVWKEAHMMESKLRGEAVLERFDRMESHFTKQEEATAALSKQINRWAGGLAALLGVVGLVVGVVEILKK